MLEEKTLANNKEPLFSVLPVTNWEFPNLREMWDYRELLLFLTRRDIKIRYKQTALGIGWAIIPPLFNMVIFTLIFGGLAKLPSEGVPYAVFSYIGLVPWGLFSKAFSGAGNSLLKNAGISAKVYYPRLINVLSSVLSSLIDSGISFLILIALLIGFGLTPSNGIWALPLFILLGITTALAGGLWIAAFSAQFRDIVQATPLLITVLMYASPVAYSPTLVPEGFISTIYWMNPIAILVQGFRWVFLGSELPSFYLIGTSCVMVFFLLIGGLFYFHRVEKTFIDLV